MLFVEQLIRDGEEKSTMIAIYFLVRGGTFTDIAR